MQRMQPNALSLASNLQVRASHEFTGFKVVSLILNA